MDLRECFRNEGDSVTQDEAPSSSQNDAEKAADRELDRAAERALEQLAQQASPEAEQAREFVELFGVLGLGQGEETPAPAVRESLMARIEAEGRAGRAQSAAPGRVVSFPKPRDLDLESPGSGTRFFGISGGLAAAGLAAASLLLALLAGSLWGQLGTVRTELADLRLLQEEIDQGVLQGPAVAQEPRIPITGQIQTATRVGNPAHEVVSPGTEICLLHGVGPDQQVLAGDEARGVFYVAPDRKRWVLAANELEPCGPDRHYQVWFKTGTSVVHAGSFCLDRKGSIQITADEMPEGAEAVMVTIEAGDHPSEPSGPLVLYGDQPHRMI